MKKYILIIIFNLAFISSCKAEENLIKGLYIDYEGAEYERTLIPCNSDESWKVEDSGAFQELSSLYKNSKLSKYGELYVELKGKHSVMNRNKFPNSHYSGTFHITTLVNSSTNSKLIEKCRSIEDTKEKTK